MSARAGSWSGPTMTTEIDGVAVDRPALGGRRARSVGGARGRNGGLLVAPPRRRAPRTAPRPARVRRGAGDDGHPAALPVGQPRRVGQLRGRRSQGRPGPGLAAAAAARFGGPCDARSALGRPRMAGRSPRRRHRARELRLRRPRGPDRGVPVSAPRPLRGHARGIDAVDQDHRRGERGDAGAGCLRLSPLLPATRHGARRLGGRAPGSRAAAAGPADAADGRARAGGDRDGPARRAHLRRCVHRAPARAPVLDLGLAPAHRGAFRRGLPIRPGLRAR